MAAPLGNTNGARGVRWRSALERAIDAWPDAYDGGANELMKGINAAAYAYVAKMMTDNDLGFFKEFGDRIDGKSMQAMEVSVSSHETALEALM
jgi:hypothetical protein